MQSTQAQLHTAVDSSVLHCHAFFRFLLMEGTGCYDEAEAATLCCCLYQQKDHLM